jgi:glycosyltransferase involved in cell wall biosynthesis
LVKLQAFRPDIINLHNLHGVGLPPAVVGELTRIAPVVWTLHDMWAITGGCCHAFDCRKFVTGCDQTCQSRWPLSTRARRQAGHNWQARARLYHDLKRVSFVTPSTWLAAEASQGLLREARIHVIPNGLDLGEYKPLDRAYVRECLGLAPTAKVVLFAAAWLADTHKGLPYLLDALDRLADQYEEVCLLTTGEGVLPETVAPSRVQHVHLGSFVTPRLMRLAYNAADVYALPSLAENLPNTLVEAIACGTPCVGFDVGGVREVIRAGNTGFLAEPENSASLAEALTSVLAQSAGEWQAMSGRCRAIAEAEYGLDLCAQRYLSLFSNLLETEP